MATTFLAETWGRRIECKDAILPLMGMIPSEDLLAELPAKETMDIMLMQANDIRHLLKTVADLEQRPKHAVRPTVLNFHLMDPDAVMLARNCVLMELALTVDPTDTKDLLFLWNVWYSMELSRLEHARLMSTLDEMMKVDRDGEQSQRWGFADDSTMMACGDVWRSWITDTHDVSMTARRRIRIINAQDDHVLNAALDQGTPIPDYVSHDQGIWEAFSALRILPCANDVHRPPRVALTTTLCSPVEGTSAV